MKTSFIETIRAYNGEVFNISYHQKRYESVLNAFGVKYMQDLSKYLKPPKDGLYRCRLSYSTDEKENIEVEYYKYKKREIESLKIIYDDKIEYSYKYSDRTELEKLFEHREGCDDILIVKNSLVTDTSVANIALFRDGMWFTPRTPLLKGTTRQRLLETAKIVESDIYVEDLKSFTKAALLNAMIDFDIITNISFKE